METVLITGASSGLGLALTREFLKGPFRVVATARASSLSRFARLGFVESDRLSLRALDLTDFAQIENLVREIESDLGGLEVIVNNAGISYRSVVEHMTAEDEETQMRVNYLGPFHLIRQALPRMRERRHGRIINISSVSGMMAMPTMASYSASKFALEGASEALWYELKPWNVYVTLVQLGFIHSESFRNVYMTEQGRLAQGDKRDPYYEYYRGMGPFVEKLMKVSPTTPEGISRKVVRLLESSNPPVRMAGTVDAYFFSMLRRCLPRGLYHRVLYASLPHIRNWGSKSLKSR